MALIMKLTTLTTCDQDGPHVRLIIDQEAFNAALLQHYSDVWSCNGAEGDCPETWAKIEQALKEQDLLRERDVVYLQRHDLLMTLPG